MAEYIEREAFLKQERDWYCKDCNRRKNSKGRKVYGIGDVPCRSCGMDDILTAVEDYPASDVRPVVHGKWIPAPAEYEGETPNIWWKCSVCGQKIYSETERDRKEFHAFCSRCGADMRGANNGT